MFKKNMKLGKQINLFLILLLLLPNFSFAEDKIISTPLINLDKIKPSFEELNTENDDLVIDQNLKEKKKSHNLSKSPHAILIGLDKITAKSS